MPVHVLAGDIGGTKTNLAIYAVAGVRHLSPLREASFPSRQFSSLGDIVRTFLASGTERVAAAAFGIAGAVHGEVVVPTNLPWAAVEAGNLSSEIGGGRVRLMNDLATTAYGALFLPPDEIHTLNPGQPKAGNRAIIAAGTGLGQAVLFWDGTRYHPSSSEGGHADFAPRTETEIALLQFLLTEYARVSYERVLSGPGAFNIFRFLDVALKRPVAPVVREGLKNAENPSAVVGEAAMAGTCRTCEEVLDLFVSIYGAQAGNLALSTMAVGGVYIGGGIVTRILPKITTGTFMQAFVAKQPFAELMADVPVRIILNTKTSQLGAAHAAAELVEH
jgi:glucokinase